MRSFSKAEVEVRRRLIHVTAASVLFFQDTTVALFAQPQPRPLVLAVSALFSGPDCQMRLLSRVASMVHHTIHDFETVVACGKREAPPSWICGSLQRTRRQALPVFWLEEGRLTTCTSLQKT
jgi:hypothetical protein